MKYKAIIFIGKLSCVKTISFNSFDELDDNITDLEKYLNSEIIIVKVIKYERNDIKWLISAKIGN